MFHCGHKFHQECLAEAVLPYLSVEETTLVAHVTNALGEMAVRLEQEGRLSQALMEEREEERERLRDVVACECLYCGHRMVECVGKAFLEEGEEGVW